MDSNDDDSSISPPSSPVEHVKPASSLLVSPAQQSFNQQVQAFVDLHEKQGKPLLVEDEEVNTLMIKAIQVLRINLLELEKVQELCKDFCQRYITCLRTKMSSENLLRGTTAFGSGGHGGLGFDASSRSSSPSSDDNSMPPAHPHHSRHQRRMSSLRNRKCPSVSNGIGYIVSFPLLLLCPHHFALTSVVPLYTVLIVVMGNLCLDDNEHWLQAI